MRRFLLLAAMLCLAVPAVAQQAPGAPSPGSPSVQGGAPEIGVGRGPMPAGNPPNTTEPQRPTGVATQPPPQAAAPTPVTERPAVPPPALRNSPDAAERELQAALRGERIEGRITIPDPKAASLIQPEGRDWRQFHNVTLTWVGGVAVGGMLLILVAFYLTRGRIRIEGGRSGRTIQRFNLLERVNHWMTASTFIVLGLTGLNLTFGRHVILPLMGPEAFYGLTHWGKILHNYLAFPFTLGITLMLLLWVKDNIPNGRDIAWFKAGGGLIGHGHVEAGRFNGGQKMVFWITVLGGAAVAVSGYFLIFPFWVSNVNDLQLAHTVHALISVLMIAAMVAHIYIGSLGMEGAYDAMGSGQVDLNWAKEHHGLWVQEEMAKARQTIAAPANAKAAGAD
ncbi:MAG: formate dehydrogenase subunit gamma [Acetobacteraceae bacterium]|nr:formate dehydrogenase subunit gamma [Acetobacteraceae bacterium]